MLTHWTLVALYVCTDLLLGFEGAFAQMLTPEAAAASLYYIYIYVCVCMYVYTCCSVFLLKKNMNILYIVDNV